MLVAQSKKLFFSVLAVLVVAVSVFNLSCQKELSGEGFIVTETQPDLSTKIASSVSGFVTDENDAAVNGATVQFGSGSTSTDKYGYFEFSNVQVVKNAAVVTVLQPGYFKGIKTYTAVAGKSAFFRIKLLPKTTAGNFDAATGGTVTLSNGLAVSFPANAIMTASSGSAYSGQVNVAAQWINPVAADLNLTMPGDLRGLDSLGFMRLLTSYGMCAVELTGASGELLQVATGKKASLNFPIPASLSSSAPANLPLWYFDENKGLWKQEGIAVKSGSSYVGEVSHFSYWNCDFPLATSVPFTATITDAAGNPLPGVTVSVKYANGTYTGAHGYTDSSGFVNGRLPGNSQLILEVYSYYNCGNAVYTQNITTTDQALDLGSIALPAVSTVTVTGNVVNCSNAPVTSGFIIMRKNNINYHYPVSSTGAFSFNTTLCNSTADVTLLAEDNLALQAGIPQNLTLTPGTVSAGTLSACGTTIDEFINYSVNGTPYSLISPADQLTQSVNTQFTPIQMTINGFTGNGGTVTEGVNISFDQTGIAAGSSQNLLYFYTRQINDSSNLSAPALVNITEYGAVGQFVAGNFSCTLVGAPPANVNYNVTCDFRVRRNQ